AAPAPVDPTLQPTRIASAADNTALVGSSSGGAASAITTSVMETQARISTGATASPTTGATTATYAGSVVGGQTLVSTISTAAAGDPAAAAAADLALKEQLRCAYVKTGFTASTSQGPD